MVAADAGASSGSVARTVPEPSMRTAAVADATTIPSSVGTASTPAALASPIEARSTVPSGRNEAWSNKSMLLSWYRRTAAVLHVICSPKTAAAARPEWGSRSSSAPGAATRTRPLSRITAFPGSDGRRHSTRPS